MVVSVISSALCAKNKKPAERFASAGRMLMSAVGSGIQIGHPRRRAVRVMMMAVVKMERHAESENRRRQCVGQVFKRTIVWMWTSNILNNR
jgi:hypothetical protein